LISDRATKTPTTNRSSIDIEQIKEWLTAVLMANIIGTITITTTITIIHLSLRSPHIHHTHHTHRYRRHEPQSADQDYWTGRTILTPAALRPNNQSKPKKAEPGPKPKQENFKDSELYVAPVRPPIPARPHNDSVWIHVTPPQATSPPWAPAPSRYGWTTTISTPGSGYARGGAGLVDFEEVVFASWLAGGLLKGFDYDGY
ncbi:hypothetical protein F5876DRAFT_68082, partial [Lentinula aff. lateritia]